MFLFITLILVDGWQNLTLYSLDMVYIHFTLLVCSHSAPAFYMSNLVYVVPYSLSDSPGRILFTKIRRSCRDVQALMLFLHATTLFMYVSIVP